jgi:hypothetical protein
MRSFSNQRDKMKYTVVGYYPDNDQPWAATASADTWQEAVQICSKDVASGWKVKVCGVIEGDHMMVDDMDETLELEGPGDVD